ncbi:hypothetical protein BDW72DRAFT_199696 [Aspergillus terricola var. indicus]
MSLSDDDHVVLLLSCIQHSDIQKIDFAAVAQQCNITTSGAAAKRYQRLLKAHREGKVTAGDNGAPAGAGLDGANQSQNQNQTASGAAKNGRKRKEPAPKEDGNGDEPAPKRKRGRPSRAKAPAERAAEEGNHGIEKGEDDIPEEETYQASNTRRAFGGEETTDEDDEA